jgi:lipoprotein-anchoring transpeptidase ErfK/SrfK
MINLIVCNLLRQLAGDVAKVGVCMHRNRVFCAVVLLSFVAFSPALAAKIKFSPAAFQVFGGMGGEPIARHASNSWRKSPSYKALLHKTVSYQSGYDPGTVIVRTGERKLYYVLNSDEAIEYNVGVGREGYQWQGSHRITSKAEWPSWRPPPAMIKRERKRGHDIPVYMAGGVENPLGARAIYIGNTEYRIHGTTQPWSIGKAMSSGCIRMMNEEVIDLYNRVKIGNLVVVQ